MPLPQHFDFRLEDEDSSIVLRVRYEGNENNYGSAMVIVNGERVELERFRRFINATAEALNSESNTRTF